jgi:hypothetical protein
MHVGLDNVASSHFTAADRFIRSTLQRRNRRTQQSVHYDRFRHSIMVLACLATLAVHRLLVLHRLLLNRLLPRLCLAAWCCLTCGSSTSDSAVVWCMIEVSVEGMAAGVARIRAGIEELNGLAQSALGAFVGTLYRRASRGGSLSTSVSALIGLLSLLIWTSTFLLRVG